MGKITVNIIEKISKLDWWSRQKAISCLIKHPEEQFSGLLEKSLRNHDNADIRNAAMEIFKALGAKAIKYLSPLLKDHDAEVRLFSANIIGEIGDKEALPYLLVSIKDPDENVRIASAEALGKIGDKKALNGLKMLLSDDPWVAMAALQAIGEIGGEKGLKILYDCLDQEEFQSFAITMIGNKGNNKSIKYLTRLIDTSGPALQRELVLEAIIKIAERERFKPRPGNFTRLVPLLIDIINSTNSDMKKSAFIALCWSENIKGLPLFLEATEDEELQEYAIDGILSIGKKAVPAITETMKMSSGSHRSMLAKVLSMLGESRALIQFKKDENPEVRTEVALALGTVNTNTSIRALLKMLSDPFDEVRMAARRSLALLNKGNL